MLISTYKKTVVLALSFIVLSCFANFAQAQQRLLQLKKIYSVSNSFTTAQCQPYFPNSSLTFNVPKQVIVSKKITYFTIPTRLTDTHILLGLALISNELDPNDPNLVNKKWIGKSKETRANGQKIDHNVSMTGILNRKDRSMTGTMTFDNSCAADYTSSIIKA